MHLFSDGPHPAEMRGDKRSPANSLRLGLVGPLPPPSGGMANQTRQLAQLLKNEGVLVSVVRFNAPYRPEWVASHRGIRGLFRLCPYLLQLWVTAGRVDVFHVMANSGWAWHLCAAPAIWIAKLRGIPVVVNYRGGNANEFFSRSFRFVKPTLQAADEVVVPSGFLDHVFGRFGVRVKVIPNIIDIGRFVRRQALAASGVEPHVIVTRNLEAIYDVATAIRAVAILKLVYPRIRMTIAGEGPERERLEDLVHTLALDAHVTFTGRLDNLGIESLYQQADVFINPSLVDNMPISILEALASEVPVVSTRVGGVPFMVQDGKHALLVPPGDPQAMANAVCELLQDPSRTRELTRAGRDCAEQYAWANVRPQWLGTYARARASRMRGIAAPVE
jgi:glycosyltransferase involved in cell wall biosynthesis